LEFQQKFTHKILQAFSAEMSRMREELIACTFETLLTKDAGQVTFFGIFLSLSLTLQQKYARVLKKLTKNAHTI